MTNRSLIEFPPNPQADRIAEVTGVPVHVVSTSPDRDHTILLHNTFAA